MEHCLPQLRGQMVIIYIECNRSATLARRRIRAEFSRQVVRVVLDACTLAQWASQLARKGSLEYSRRVRARTARTTENIDKVMQELITNGIESTRRTSQTMDLSRITLQRILKKDITEFPYKAHPGKRMIYSEKILAMRDSIPDISKLLIFTDEAHFDLNGNVNKQNYRIWALKNLHRLILNALHPQNVIVWNGLHDHRT